ncbi:MAG: hypothetical protein H6707_16055 [Deltaproteobacteria bacterium]|nr:hypothetical protein [Deltaproteobacteria bacterium]
MAQAGVRLTKRIFIFGLVWVAVYGGYHGYCSHKAREKVRQATRALSHLRQGLLARVAIKGAVGSDDVEAVVRAIAKKSETRVMKISVEIKPYDATSAPLLAKPEREALRMVEGIGRDKKRGFVVGYQATLLARHRVATASLRDSRYVYLRWVMQENSRGGRAGGR